MKFHYLNGTPDKGFEERVFPVQPLTHGAPNEMDDFTSNGIGTILS